MSGSSQDLTVRLIPLEHAVLVEITGRLDTLTHTAFAETLQGAIADGYARLVGDLRGVDYLSSAGLGALLGAAKEARRNGGDLRLARPSEKVLKVLEFSGFTSILQFYPDPDAALASYAG